MYWDLDLRDPTLGDNATPPLLLAAVPLALVNGDVAAIWVL